MVGSYRINTSSPTADTTGLQEGRAQQERKSDAPGNSVENRECAELSREMGEEYFDPAELETFSSSFRTGLTTQQSLQACQNGQKCDYEHISKEAKCSSSSSSSVLLQIREPESLPTACHVNKYAGSSSDATADEIYAPLPVSNPPQFPCTTSSTDISPSTPRMRSLVHPDDYQLSDLEFKWRLMRRSLFPSISSSAASSSVVKTPQTIPEHGFPATPESASYCENQETYAFSYQNGGYVSSSGLTSSSSLSQGYPASEPFGTMSESAWSGFTLRFRSSFDDYMSINCREAGQEQNVGPITGSEDYPWTPISRSFDRFHGHYQYFDTSSTRNDTLLDRIRQWTPWPASKRGRDRSYGDITSGRRNWGTGGTARSGGFSGDDCFQDGPLSSILNCAYTPHSTTSSSAVTATTTSSSFGRLIRHPQPGRRLTIEFLSPASTIFRHIRFPGIKGGTKDEEDLMREASCSCPSDNAREEGRCSRCQSVLRLRAIILFVAVSCIIVFAVIVISVSAGGGGQAADLMEA